LLRLIEREIPRLVAQFGLALRARQYLALAVTRTRTAIPVCLPKLYHAGERPWRTDERPEVREGNDAMNRHIHDAATRRLKDRDAQAERFRDGRFDIGPPCPRAVEHHNAEAPGCHVSKRGTCREALEAMAMAAHQRNGRIVHGVQFRQDPMSAA